MKTQVIMAGHGGQGVLDLANFVSFYHMLKGMHVAYTPSYGPESRGGKVKCYVVVSDEEIDSPIVEEPDCLIIMNTPSMDFVPILKKGGTLLMNTSLIKDEPKRDDVKAVKVPVTDIAAGLSELKLEGVKDPTIAANSAMFGAYLALGEKTFEDVSDAVNEVFAHFLTDRKKVYIPLNLNAVQRGYSYVSQGGKGHPQAQVVTS
ncbi:MAG TPA: 2-oxoacid:acceptor oxidoreductase family protein [Nitrososphaerales archaeon]|nr:2-oxoacid:acceptor oxidoreductase family protein [Nitrososphaerales archaeon]